MGRGERTANSSLLPRNSLGQAATEAALSHPERNEDRCLLAPEHSLIAVFDGMGGEGSGDVASEAASSFFAKQLKEIPNDPFNRMRWLQVSLQQASAAVREACQKNQRAGTTATIATISEDWILVASVGDSRAYRYNQNGLEQLSKDDSVWRDDPLALEAQECLDQAETEADLRAVPGAEKLFNKRNVLGSALGHLGERVEVQQFEVEDGDLLLVTSDGIHDNLTKGEISSICEKEKTPKAISKGLIEAARQRSQDPAHLRSKDDDLSAVVLAT